MSNKTRKLQLLTELFSEEQIQQLITERLSQFVVIDEAEPEGGPVFWFNTTRPIGLYISLDDYNDEAVLTATVDGEEYAISDVDEIVLGEDGLYEIHIT